MLSRLEALAVTVADLTALVESLRAEIAQRDREIESLKAGST